MRLFRFSIDKPTDVVERRTNSAKHISFIIKQRNWLKGDRKHLRKWTAERWVTDGDKTELERRVRTFKRDYIFAEVSDTLTNELINFDNDWSQPLDISSSFWNQKGIFYKDAPCSVHYWRHNFNHIYSRTGIRNIRVASVCHLRDNKFLFNKCCLETLTPIETLALSTKAQK